jgi:hypothetical protein
MKLVNELINVEEYKEPVIFHCYWNGILSEKHLLSIKSCWYFNVQGRTNRSIILWIEKNTPTIFNTEIAKYAEVRQFDFSKERIGTQMEKPFYHGGGVTFYSDAVRSLLLVKYGGCWFDLDIVFLKSFDPLFSSFKDECVVYQWETHSFPNNAIYISLIPNSPKMIANNEFIMKRAKGWGCQEAGLTFDLPLDMIVLPCEWCDPSFVRNSQNIHFRTFFKAVSSQFTFETFFPNSFCYHWHNQWNSTIEPTSIAAQLRDELDKKLRDLH